MSRSKQALMLGNKMRTAAEVRNLSPGRAQPVLLLQHAFFYRHSRSKHLDV